MNKNNAIFADLDRHVFEYGSDLAVYTEKLVEGRLLSVALQDNGVAVYEYSHFQDRPAFDLTIDGHSLDYGWEYADFSISDGEQGSQIGKLTLNNTIKPIRLILTTACCGFGFFKRSIEIVNLSDNATAGLTGMVPFKGSVWPMKDSLAENLKDSTVVPYSVGRFKDLHWSNEGNFAWQDLAPNAGFFMHSTSGMSGHGNPFFVLRNNIYGGYLIGQMGWSSNWKFSFCADFNNDRHGHETTVKLDYELQPIAPAPARMIAPGEAVLAPVTHFGVSHGDFDTAIQNLHAYQRQSVLRVAGDGLQPVIYNQAGYMQPSYQEPAMSEEGLKREIDIAAELGAELFTIDAGWYGKNGRPGMDWGVATGDWYPADGLPNDLHPIFDYARSRGLKCGLWAEIETAGSASKVAADHPDWFLERRGKSVVRLLDLSKPDVQAFVESEIVRLVETYRLDLFRLDYNSYAGEGGFNLKEGAYENTHWRHMEALYAIFDRVGRRFPDLLLENCASGGGRTDIGLVSRFTTTWVSDWFKMPRTVRILNGMSMALPPEYINRTFGAVMEGGYAGNAETQLHVAILAHPTLCGIARSLERANPALMALTKKYVGIYKDFIRPFHRQARVYHHTPVIAGSDGEGWAALEYVSEDGSKAAAAAFRLVNAQENIFMLRLKGLKKNANYRVRHEPDGAEFVAGGYELTQSGIRIALDNALASRLLLLEEVRPDEGGRAPI